MTLKNKRIGVVGTGRMGANIARRLVDKGYRVSSLYDRNTEAASVLAKEINSSPKSKLSHVSAESDVVITIVSDDAAMREIFGDGADSLLHEARGKIFINCATVSPSVHQEIEKACEQSGASSLEACMASSITQARDGTLYLMLAGKRETYAEVEPLLRDLSKSMRYIGPAGEAAKVKALVNMVMNINTAGLAEGLGLGAALGLDLAMLKEVFSQTGANSRVLETDGDDMISRVHDCFFSAAHAAKDSSIANKLARDVGCEIPLSVATEAQYRSLIALGRGELDKSAVAELTFPGRKNG